ncbi:MAG: uridylate kinase [Methylococcales bacterium]|nr:uridylate kinase [Methylococcales bacterium]
MTKIHVVKLGGSLEKSKQLIGCLNKIETLSQEMVIIVPGGGLFADNVRQSQQCWHFNDVIAHEMAILAMQQMALLFQGLQANFQVLNLVNDIQKQIKIKAPFKIIWSPCIDELNEATIKASWGVTSDSLAAWLAIQLHASQLTIIKAINIPCLASLSQLEDQGIIDREFSFFVSEACFNIQIINANHFLDHCDFKQILENSLVYPL